MPVVAERRRIDEGNRRARVGTIGLHHCMREGRFKIVVVRCVEPDLRQDVALAEPADGRSGTPRCRYLRSSISARVLRAILISLDS